jgi:hypothetical protein
VTLADSLIETDYQQVPLSRSGVGHFHARGSLNMVMTSSC